MSSRSVHAYPQPAGSAEDAAVVDAVSSSHGPV
jgi:hypothetical protein